MTLKLVIGAIVLCALGGCGKKGDPLPPVPDSKIVYPGLYPKPE